MSTMDNENINSPPVMNESGLLTHLNGKISYITNKQ